MSHCILELAVCWAPSPHGEVLCWPKDGRNLIISCMKIRFHLAKGCNAANGKSSLESTNDNFGIRDVDKIVEIDVHEQPASLSGGAWPNWLQNENSVVPFFGSGLTSLDGLKLIMGCRPPFSTSCGLRIQRLIAVNYISFFMQHQTRGWALSHLCSSPRSPPSRSRIKSERAALKRKPVSSEPSLFSV